jgi:hypothetical protein
MGLERLHRAQNRERVLTHHHNIMENFPYTFEISKQTARDINKARRAIAETDKAKLSKWERQAQADELNPNVATLRIEGAVNLTVPIRCDILAKWTAAHDCDTFRLQVAESLAITVSANGSSILKLLAPQFPAGILPIKANNGFIAELVPDFDVSTACLTAKTLRARTAEAKKEGEQMREQAEETRQLEEYEQALALFTAANIQRAAQSGRSLRKLKCWARRVSPIIDSVPNPLNIDEFRELDPILSPEILQSYAHKWQQYIAAKKRHDEYAPRGYYNASKERPRREKAMTQTRSDAQSVLISGVHRHVSGFGFTSYACGAQITVGHRWESFAANVSAAKKTVRSYSPPLAIAA